MLVTADESDISDKTEIDDNRKIFIVGRDEYWYACEGVVEEDQVIDARIDRACLRIRKDEFALESEGWFEWTLSNRTDDDTQVEVIPRKQVISLPPRYLYRKS